MVKQYDGIRDGHKAWQALCDWYDADLIKNDNAEIFRVRLDGLKLYPRVSASDYINNFTNLSNELNKIDGEAYNDNHYKSLFLKNIEHPNYKVIKNLLRGTKDVGLQEERELLTERFDVKNVN